MNGMKPQVRKQYRIFSVSISDPCGIHHQTPHSMHRLFISFTTLNIHDTVVSNHWTIPKALSVSLSIVPTGTAVCYVNPYFEKISYHRNRSHNGSHGGQRPNREPWPTLHFYSNYAGRLVLGAGDHDLFNTETYPLESIKEFESVSSAWKRLLANLLRKGTASDANTRTRKLFSTLCTEPHC